MATGASGDCGDQVSVVEVGCRVDGGTRLQRAADGVGGDGYRDDWRMTASWMWWHIGVEQRAAPPARHPFLAVMHHNHWPCGGAQAALLCRSVPAHSVRGFW